MTAEGVVARRRWPGLVARWGFLLVAAVLAVVALVDQWDDVRGALEQVGALHAARAVLAAGGASVCSAEQQRVLLGAAGTSVPARSWTRIYYVAQLGKYVPGTAWAYLAQMELSRRHGARRAASLLTMLLGAALSVLTAVVVAVPAVLDGGVEGVPGWVTWTAVALATVALGVVVVRPDVAVGLVRSVAGRVRRAAVPDLAVGGSAVRWAVAWSFGSWVLYGLHLAAIIDPLGASGLTGTVTALGTFALAWVAGFLVVIAPAGVGVREAVMVAVLGPVVGTGAALAAALLSRFLVIAAELVLAGGAALVRERVVP